MISYRGTDNLPVDSLFGYGVAAGVSDVNQGALASGFYRTVAGEIDPRTANISVTGHSLGGGLAGLVGAVYGKEGALFDNMPFEAAALSVPSPAQTTINPSFKQLVYGDADPWAVTISSGTDSKLQAYSLDGEFLAWARPLQQTPDTQLSIGTDVNLPGLDSGIAGGGLHSQSTQVIRLFFQEQDGSPTPGSWGSIAPQFWPVLYDPGFAQSIGMDAIQGISNSKGEYDGILRALIAYSAIDEGTRVFGDTGIRALYDDANELGAALSAAGAGSSIEEYAEEISQAFVQFSGQLALSKINQGDNELLDETQGVLRYDPVNGNLLVVDFRDDLWEAINNGVLPANDNVQERKLVA